MSTKKKKIAEKKIKERTEKETKTNKTYVNALKQTINENYPKPQQLVIETETGFHIASAMIYAHLQNMAAPGCFNDELNKMLRLNGLPEIRTPDSVNSTGVLNMVLSAGSAIITAPIFPEKTLIPTEQSLENIEDITDLQDTIELPQRNKRKSTQSPEKRTNTAKRLTTNLTNLNSEADIRFYTSIKNKNKIEYNPIQTIRMITAGTMKFAYTGKFQIKEIEDYIHKGKITISEDNHYPTEIKKYERHVNGKDTDKPTQRKLSLNA